MIKKELLSMPKLCATPHMMQLARSDKLTKIKYDYYTKVEYKRNVYVRCCIKNGILKMALFFTENMRMGGTLPTLEIYVDREKRQYLTYDYRKEKWLTASVYRLDTPTYCYFHKVWYARETRKALAKYFNSDKEGMDALYRFQCDVLAENLKKRHKKETDPWDEDLKQTPELPKDWLKWVSMVGVPQHFIFYQYSRKKSGQTGYCTHCAKDVPIKKPRYNKEGVCPKCGASVIYKALGRCGTVETRYYNVHLVQRCNDGLILREFCANRRHPKGNHKEAEANASELRRVICDKNGIPIRAYYFGNYKNAEYRWIEGCLASVSRGYIYFYNSYEGKVYGKTLPSIIKNELKKTGFMEYYRRKGVIEPERFLRAIEQEPYLEKFAKVGLTALMDEIMRNGYWDRDGFTINKDESSLLKILNINSQQLKRLIAINSGTIFLHWFQYEKAHNQTISDKTLHWLCKNELRPKDFDFIRGRMSIEQIHNYIVRKMREERMTLKEVITTWSDYLSMAKRLNLDTNDAIIYRVNKLKLRHDELVEICNNKDDAVRAGEILEIFPNIEQVLSELKEKYEFSDGKYSIIVPEKIEDILLEGRTLSHCVSNDKYWERIATNESYVMFLRKAETPDIAYYTLEVEPGGTVRQKRTMYDRQNEDIDDASMFLRKWQREIAVRMTKKDRSLAQKSKILRLEEFKQMDNDNILINTGLLQGQRLVDVLMADLMEAA